MARAPESCHRYAGWTSRGRVGGVKGGAPNGIGRDGLALRFRGRKGGGPAWSSPEHPRRRGGSARGASGGAAALGRQGVVRGRCDRRPTFTRTPRSSNPGRAEEAFGPGRPVLCGGTPGAPSGGRHRTPSRPPRPSGTSRFGLRRLVNVRAPCLRGQATGCRMASRRGFGLTGWGHASAAGACDPDSALGAPLTALTKARPPWPSPKLDVDHLRRGEQGTGGGSCLCPWAVNTGRCFRRAAGRTTCGREHRFLARRQVVAAAGQACSRGRGTSPTWWSTGPARRERWREPSRSLPHPEAVADVLQAQGRRLRPLDRWMRRFASARWRGVVERPRRPPEAGVVCRSAGKQQGLP